MKKEMESKYTTGIDIVDVSRFKNILEDEHFKKRVFSDKELEYIFSTSNQEIRLNRIAARFAAKEAFFKAVTSLEELIMKDVTVIHDDKGRPSLLFSGKTKIFVEKNKFSFDLSISHDGGLAVATVICYQAS